MRPVPEQKLIHIDEEIEATEETMEQIADAIKWCTSTLLLVPNNVDLFLRRAWLYVKCDQFQHANMDYAIAIYLKPSIEIIALWRKARLKYEITVNTRCNEAIVAILLGRFDDARALYSSALRLDPTNKMKNAELHCSMANLAHMMGDLVECIWQYTKALSLDTKSVRAYGNRGVAHMDSRNFSAAANDFEEALRLDPNSGYKRLFDQANRRAAARALKKIGKRSSMHEDMSIEAYHSICKAIDNLKADDRYEKKALVKLYIRKGIAANKIHLHKIAITACSKALLMNPTKLMALRCRAKTYLTMSRYETDCLSRNSLIERAVEDLEYIVTLQPTERNKSRLALVKEKLDTTVVVLYNRGFDAYLERKYQEAHNLLCNALQKCDENPSLSIPNGLRDCIIYFKEKSAVKIERYKKCKKHLQ